ncbi:alpha/beta fold hydrolase [Candidatus Woesearchaeota archaeon]|nr:alpha/beta fold hydrolase [Candidatus Woesearchaeota archaeon]
MKIRKNHLYFGIIAAAVLIAVFLYYKNSKESQTTENNAIKESSNPWQVDANGYLSYPLDRGDVLFNRQNYDETNNLTISKIIYQSRNGNIYGLLVLPKFAAELLPGVVLLPGAGVSKESELKLAKEIAELNAAVLVIDQRGTGETAGILPKIEDDYAAFLSGQEPYQHLMVYDALRAYDLLYSAPFVDPERIIIAGESLGGRIAVIAAAIDRNIKGVLVISSSGLDFGEANDTKVNAFLQSIDSDHYIAQITPRKIVMMHNYNDAIIPLSSAISTYQKAQQPKHFVLVNDTSCNHGYCDSMHDGMIESLDYLVGIRSKTLASVPVR